MLVFKEVIDGKPAILFKITKSGEFDALKSWCRTTFGKSHGIVSVWRVLNRHAPISLYRLEQDHGTFVVIKDLEQAIIVQLIFM